MYWLDGELDFVNDFLFDDDSVDDFLQDNDHIRIEKELIVLIQTYPDALLQSDGEKDQLVLER